MGTFDDRYYLSWKHMAAFLLRSLKLGHTMVMETIMGNDGKRIFISHVVVPAGDDDEGEEEG